MNHVHARLGDEKKIDRVVKVCGSVELLSGMGFFYYFILLVCMSEMVYSVWKFNVCNFYLFIPYASEYCKLCTYKYVILFYIITHINKPNIQISFSYRIYILYENILEFPFEDIIYKK